MKVGDRVRVLVGQDGLYKVGDVGVLRCICDDRTALVQFDEGQEVCYGGRWYAQLEHLEPESLGARPTCLDNVQWTQLDEDALLLAQDGTTICRISVVENGWPGSAQEVAQEIVRRLRNG